MTDKFKICMIGGSAVGKTSLVARYASSIFSERYSTTVGVRIQSRRLHRGERSLDLILWDLSGEDEFQSVQPAYLRGTAGYLVVIDGTRRETLDTALMLQERARTTTAGAPFVVVVNKADLTGDWEIRGDDLEALTRRGWPLVRTSAKTGAGVDEAFERLTTLILDRQAKPWS
jgi:small GTP-binding protein